MWISRLRVTSGFLADLDVKFSQGLNVVIGPRGTGKTTLLELLRHALGVRSANTLGDADRARLVHLLLGSGDVVVDIEDGHDTHRLVVDADGGGRRPEFAGLALILGQNELESIASNASNRLSLIDLRAQVTTRAPRGQVQSNLTLELALNRELIAELEEQLRARPLVQADYDDAIAAESILLQHATLELAEQRQSLRELEDSLLASQQEVEQLRSLRSEIGDAQELAVTLSSRLTRTTAGPIPSAVREESITIVEVAELVGLSVLRLSSILESLSMSVDLLESQQSIWRTQSAPMRAHLDEAERGLGEVTTRLRKAKAQLARLDNIDGEVKSLLAQHRVRQRERDALLDATEAQLEERFEARQGVGALVSSQLAESVTISVEHLADFSEFKSFLSRSMQGSGLRYAALAEQVARTTLPRQLLELLESNDLAGLAVAAGVALERAARFAEHLQRPELLAELATVQLDDRVDFLLQDGATTKSVEQLSTGQKCAVTLPILLTEHERTLVLDQPEDHLDNAYLVENIVVALDKRSGAGAQTIVATHNANIPVLGSASTVIAMTSDGRRGFASAVGRFDEPAIVSTITRLMEGGREAFERRARFYSSYGSIK